METSEFKTEIGNLAARIESLAPAGGICVHQSVHDQIRDKLELDFEDLGAIEVKNIARPIPVSIVALNEKAERLAEPVTRPASSPTGRGRRAAAAAATMFVLLAGLAWWWFGTPEFEPLHAVEMDHPLPDKPSIAVMAFSDLSAGPEKGYLSDAISEEIIARLSRFPDFFVIARNSSFFYRDKAADTRDIAKELGVRYVLEGSQQ